MNDCLFHGSSSTPLPEALQTIKGTVSCTHAQFYNKNQNYSHIEFIEAQNEDVKLMEAARDTRPYKYDKKIKIKDNYCGIDIHGI